MHVLLVNTAIQPPTTLTMERLVIVILRAVICVDQVLGLQNQWFQAYSSYRLDHKHF